MTLPEPPYPRNRGLRRELVGLLLVAVGALVYVWATATVDWRIPVVTAAVAAIAVGLWMGNRRDDDTGEA